MIGNVVQYVLYILLFLVITSSVAGLVLSFYARRGVELTREVDLTLSILGTLASVAPYLGLFGTVWHIIQALGGIGSGNLNVAAIAQPIGAAMYATLWGLGSAILALVVHRFVLMLQPEVADEAAPDQPAEIAHG